MNQICFHCGLPVSTTIYTTVINHIQRTMCCAGCQAVAQSIVEFGFADYYDTRSGFASTAKEFEIVPPELRLYDAAENQTLHADDTHYQQASLTLENLRCPACIWLIERRLMRLPGVITAEVNATTERLQVHWQSQLCKLSDILAALRAIGYIAYPFDAIHHNTLLERTHKKLFRQLFVAGLSMMQVMMYAVPAYLVSDGSIDHHMNQLMRWAGLLLTLPALLYSAQPFFQGAWQDIKNRMPGMDIPVVLGILAAFTGSVVATWQGHGEVYFDSVTMFIFFLLGSRYMELKARRNASSALNKLLHALPESALRITHYPQSSATEIVAPAKLREGDVILIQPGKAIPTDCVVLGGTSEVDVSLLTGESLPQLKSVDSLLPGGAVNITQPLVARVTQPVDRSTLSTLLGLVQRAGQSKPRLLLWADRVAAWFVVALLLLSVTVFFLWQWLDPTRAWSIAIAVLVVSCPCALSLATPTALATAMNRLLQRHILVVQSHVLETLQRATHLILDKTGTLTTGRPTLQSIVPLSNLSTDDCLKIASALEQSSSHPLAQAILNAAQVTLNATQKLTAEQIQHYVGQGIEASVNGVTYRLGKHAFVRVLNSTIADEQQAPVETTSLYLACSAGMLARFDIADPIRPEAFAVVEYFRSQNKKLILLSGDRQPIAQHVAQQLRIDTAIGDCLPEDKLAYVQNLQKNGAVVAMVGDGINDAAVLQAANVSFAMGSGTALAQLHADCVLLSGQLSSLSEADQVASKTFSVIRQNLFWAMLYNCVAIPAATLGWINPWVSAVGMSLSSAFVVLNALRLR